MLGGFAKLKVNGVPQDVVMLGSGLLLLPTPERPGADAKRLLDWEARIGVEEGIAQTAEWLRRQEGVLELP